MTDEEIRIDLIRWISDLKWASVNSYEVEDIGGGIVKMTVMFTRRSSEIGAVSDTPPTGQGTKEACGQPEPSAKESLEDPFKCEKCGCTKFEWDFAERIGEEQARFCAECGKKE